MFVIIGAAIVTGAVFGGYLLEGGHLAVLIQPIELLIIGGAALGSMLIGAPMSVMKLMIKQILGTLKGGHVSKALYMEVLMLLYELTKTAKGNMLALEAHVEKPENSEIFKRYPKVLHNHHAISFIADTLKVQISSPLSPYDLEDLMDQDIGAAHSEEAAPPALVQKVGDAMPGLGIVAAVLGVVLTMGKLTQGKEVIGHSVASALVGTFLGILISYGFMQPLSSKMDSNNQEEGKVLDVIKCGLLAFAKDCSPKVCVEFARRSIPPEYRPTFEDVDKSTSSIKTGAAA
jgi:chemotaxis protein MotA